MRPLPESRSLIAVGVIGTVIVSNLGPVVDGSPEDLRTILAAAQALLAGKETYAEVARAGHNLNLNVPGMAVATLPFATMPFRLAAVSWTVVSALALAWTISKTRRVTGTSALLLSVWALAALTGGFVLQVGQVTFLLMPLMLLAWLADRDGRSVISGSLVGLLAYFKPFFALYAVYWFIRRDWRALGGCVLTGGFLWLITFLALPDDSAAWLRTVAVVGWEADPINGSVAGVAARLFSGRHPTGPGYEAIVVSPLLERLGYWCSAMLLLAASLVAIRRTASRDQHWAIVGVCALLVAPLGWPYYLPLFLPPLAATGALARTSTFPALLALEIPRSIIVRGDYGVIGTIILGCLPCWILLWIWRAALVTSEDGRASSGPD